MTSSRAFCQLYATPHAPYNALYQVHMLSGCWLVVLAIQCCAHFTSSGLGANASRSYGDVPLLHLQTELSRLQPLVKYSDALPDGYYTAMTVLGPHGVADDITPSFAAATGSVLTRGLAAAWLYGAFLGTQSTVGQLAPAATVPPNPQTWADLGSSDRFFAVAWRCAAAGFATPAPGPGVLFRPHDPISPRDWSGWVARALPPATQSGTSAATVVSRGAAAVELYAAAIAAAATGLGRGG